MGSFLDLLIKINCIRQHRKIFIILVSYFRSNSYILKKPYVRMSLLKRDVVAHLKIYDELRACYFEYFILNDV